MTLRFLFSPGGTEPPNSGATNQYNGIWTAADNGWNEYTAPDSVIELRTNQANDMYLKQNVSDDLVIVGFNLRQSSLPASYAELVRFTGDGAAQLDLLVESTGKLSLYRPLHAPFGTLIAQTTNQVIFAGSRTYVEIKARRGDSTSDLVLQVGGHVVALDTAGPYDTNNSGASANWEQVWICSSGERLTYLRDIYIADEQGSVNNDFLGPLAVSAVHPNGNGSSSQLTGSDSDQTDNYALVDEVTIDDTDYVISTSTSDQRDLYAMEDVSGSGSNTIVGVMSAIRAKASGSGSRSVTDSMKTGATTTDGPDQSLGSSFGWFTNIRETKPSGGAWTVTDWNGAEFGPKARP